MDLHEANEAGLASLLLEKELITEEQLNKSLQIQFLKGGYLSQILIEEGFIKDSDLTTCLTCQYGFCYLPLESYGVAENAGGSVPVSLMRDFICLPIEKNDRLLTVVMVDPLNQGVIEALRQASGCEILVFVSSRKEIISAIEKHYKILCKNPDLDKFRNDTALRDNFGQNYYVRSLKYSGPSRRRYARWSIELPAKFYSYPNTVKTKVKNISMNGVCFSSAFPLAKGTEIAMDIQLDDQRSFSVVAKVTRCEARKGEGAFLAAASLALYEAGASFNFISEEHQNTLAEYLRNLPSHNFKTLLEE